MYLFIISFFVSFMLTYIVSHVISSFFFKEDRRNRVAIVVVGDIGRSPRMRFHSLSLAAHGFHVDLIGYCETAVPKDILENKLISVVKIKPLKSLPSSLPRLCYILFAPFKAVYLFLQLQFTLLFRLEHYDYLLIQNPPSIPILLVSQIATFLNGAKLIIDWHNFGYSILGLQLGSNHIFVSFYKWFEQFFGRRAYCHISVTKAMSKELHSKWKTNKIPIVLYDRPPKMFKKLSVEEKHNFLLKLQSQSPIFDEWSEGYSSTKTLLTEKIDEKIQFRENRPMLIISSTSWSEDEDFQILLDAIVLYEKNAKVLKSKGKKVTRLFFVITGKGPKKEYYEQLIEKLELKVTKIKTIWLQSEDYPLLLGSSDLGISLHNSSSGLDLPMKVVDMFGCQLPVCALDFQSLDELVINNFNGYVFKNSQQLADQIQQLTQNETRLKEMSNNIETFKKLGWEENWDNVLLKIFQN